MTQKEQALVDRLFREIGHSTGYMTLQIRHTFTAPENLHTPLMVDGVDKIAEKMIRECEESAAALKIYRKALAERKELLEKAPSVPVARLERKPDRYDGKVYYHFSIFRRIIETGADVKESVEKFPGGQWRKARAAFLAYVKEHPDAVAENLVSAG